MQKSLISKASFKIPYDPENQPVERFLLLSLAAALTALMEAN